MKMKKGKTSVKLFRISVLALSLTLLAGCASAPAETIIVASPAPEQSAAAQTPAPTAEVPEESLSKAEELLRSMSLEEKVGQLFIIRPESLSTELTPQQAHDTTEYGVTEFTQDMAVQLEKYPAGGVAIFGKNISSPEQLKDFVSAMQQASSCLLYTSPRGAPLTPPWRGAAPALSPAQTVRAKLPLCFIRIK